VIKVSVVIPCYNGELFIGDAVQSVLQQSLTAIECIVVDDASGDRSRQIILDLAGLDARVVPVFFDENGGPSRARNAGISRAQGEWVTFLDADDLYDRHRLEELIKAVDDDQFDAAVDNQSVRKFPDGDHEYSGFSFLKEGVSAPFLAETYFVEQGKLNRFLRPGYMKAMLRLDWLKDQRVQFPEGVNVGEDFLFYAKLFAAGMKCVGVGYDGYIYRRRPSSLSLSQAVSFSAMAELIDDFLDRYGAQISDVSVHALVKRTRMLKRLSAFNIAMVSFRERSFLDALRQIAARPDCLLIAFPLARRKFERLFQRFAA
jgi:glycosyltransferase involved in cell wall biosynthesis